MGQIGGSNAIFDVAFFVFVAFFASIEAFLTFPRCWLIVESFEDPIPFAPSIRIWFGRRTRKPPDKIAFSFRDVAFRRLIVVLICVFEAIGPGESPLDPSTAVCLGAIRKRYQFCEHLREQFEFLYSQRDPSTAEERCVYLRLKWSMKCKTAGEHTMHLVTARSAIARSNFHGESKFAHLVASLRAYCRLSSPARRYTEMLYTLLLRDGANEGC